MSQVGINRVTLIGRLTRDCELRYTDGGMAICSFSLALNYRRKQGEQWVDEVNYFDLVFFGKRAEAVSRYLTRGTQVGVDGELRQDRWEQDGKTRSKVKVIVNNVELLGGRGSDGGQPPVAQSEPQPANAPGAPTSSPGGATNNAADNFEDDIPF